MTESAARGAKRRRLEAEHVDLLPSVRQEEVGLSRAPLKLLFFVRRHLSVLCLVPTC